MGKIKRLPTGISQFRSISDSNLYYVDKTMYLPKMELVSDFLFFIRPRRFGKSLFLSMVGDYYDCENPKDISQVAEDKNRLQADFDMYFDLKMNAFIRKCVGAILSFLV